MKFNTKININVYILFDMMASYINDMDFPHHIKNDIKKLYKDVLKEIKRYDNNKRHSDIEYDKYYYIDKYDDNSLAKTEINMKNYLLYNYLVKGTSYNEPYDKEIEKKIDELIKLLLNDIEIEKINYQEDKEPIATYFEVEIKYKDSSI